MDLPTAPPGFPVGPPRAPTAGVGEVAPSGVGAVPTGPVVDVPPAVAEADTGDGLDLADRVLDEVEQALVRLDRGTYGTCEQCGRPVDDDRLAEYPTARVCAGCAPAG